MGKKRLTIGCERGDGNQPVKLRLKVTYRATDFEEVGGEK